jgi:hypothetical protein
MKKAVSGAKRSLGKVAVKIIQVPQSVGRTILSVPEAVLGISKKKRNPEPDSKSMHGDKIEFISKEIVGDQENKEIVRNSQAECMKEVTNHLAIFLVEHPAATYEEWIAAIHPDNAEFADGSIDHRFYVGESDHRWLWNERMEAMCSKERLVQSRSVDPSYNRSNR